MRRRRKLRITAFGLAVILIAALAAGAVIYLGRPWYVGESGGKVALFRGHGSGLISEKLVDKTNVPVKELDGVAQDRLHDGVKFGSRKDAEAYITRLSHSTTTTSTTTSTIFGATTTTLASTSTTTK